MPGRNDWSAGFTKSAQRTKFIRHRDVKMKDSEVKKEAHISKSMCEGVCRKCVDKLQWKFKYDKYKPLKAIGNCKQCKQKVITKAYRSFCDKCAATKKVCPGCGVDLEEANKPVPVTAKAAKKAAAVGEDDDEEEEGEEGDEDEEEGSVVFGEPVEVDEAGATEGAQAAGEGGAMDEQPDEEAEEMDECDEEDEEEDGDDEDDEEEG
jgi:hypothetical protein